MSHNLSNLRSGFNGLGIAKAWGLLESAGGGTSFTITLDVAMQNTTYAVIPHCSKVSPAVPLLSTGTPASTTVILIVPWSDFSTFLDPSVTATFCKFAIYGQ
jgi:hypothetical protein